MDVLTALNELCRLYDALEKAHDRADSLSKTEEITEIRAAIRIARGNLDSAYKYRKALEQTLGGKC